jgi:hypothetical protein
MDAFLNAEFWNQDIECSIQNTNNLRLPDDGSITNGKVRNKHAKEEMR